MLCSATITATNINDAPVAVASSVRVHITSTRSFEADDFGFTDLDGDGLASVIVRSLPAMGTLAEGDTAIAQSSLPRTIAAFNIGSLNYAAPTGVTAVDDYTTFRFSVVDDGTDGADNRTSDTVTMTIHLTANLNRAATGAPTLGYDTANNA